MPSPEPPARLRCDNILVTPLGLSELDGQRATLFVPVAEVERITLRFGRSDHRPILSLTIGLLLAAMGVFGVVKFTLHPALFRYEVGMLMLGGLGGSMIYDTLRQRYFLVVHQRKLDAHLVFSKQAQREEIQVFCRQLREVYRYDVHDTT